MRFVVPAIAALLASACAAPASTPANPASPASAPARTGGHGPAAATLTVDDIQKAGAKQLTPDETRALVQSATWEGVAPSGSRFKMTQTVNGRWTGVVDTRGGMKTVGGTWQIDAEGRNCTINQSLNETVPTCTYYFRNGDVIYVTRDNQPGASVEKRTFLK